MESWEPCSHHSLSLHFCWICSDVTVAGSFVNPSTGYFPSKYLFGTCLKTSQPHTLFVSVCSQEMGKYFGDAALIVIRLGGAINRSKKGGVASRLGVFIGRNGQFFLSILVAYGSILQGYPSNLFS